MWRLLCLLLAQVQYVAEKVHCVWLSNGEMNVLFECKHFDAPDYLGSMPVECIKNKELVDEYLMETDYIPHIKTHLTMEPTETLRTKTHLK